MDAGKFFHAGLVSDDLILDCYRLAKFYAVDPTIFLRQPLSQIRNHLKWTAKLLETQVPADEDG